MIHSSRRADGTKFTQEDEHIVNKFRRILEPGEAGRGSNELPVHRTKRLLQFYARNGGLRTVLVDDVVDVS